MKESIVFLQKLQDAYSEWAKLSILICNKMGDILTEISWSDSETERLYKKHVTKHKLQTYLEPLQSITETTLLDTALGDKLILSPVKRDGVITHFIISGFIQDDQTKEVSKKVKYIRNMTEVITSYVSQHEDTSKMQDFFELVAEKMNTINDGTSTIDSILEMGTYFEDVDFMALALKSKKDTYIVEANIGDYSIALEEYEFTIGEGLLGYSIATKQSQFYQEIANDARVLAFNKIDMNVISLFCIPVINDNTVIGLLFGGSTQRELDETSVSAKLTICASLMNNHLNVQRLTRLTEHQSIEVSTFAEIFKVLTTVKDLKSVIYILIDICMNVVVDDFVSIVYKKNFESEDVGVVSRGLSKEEINDYCQIATEKVFWKKDEINITTLPWINKTSWGVDVLEYPLFFDNQVYGLLSVSFSPATEIDKYKTVLSSISIAGGIAIHLLNEEKSRISKTNIIEVIHTFMMSYDIEKHLLAERIKTTAVEFARLIRLDDLEITEQLSLLSVYNRWLPEDKIDNRKLFQLLAKYEQVLAGNSDGNISAELVALVWTYYATPEPSSGIYELNLGNTDMEQRFISFMNRGRLVEKEFTFVKRSMKKVPTDDVLSGLGLTKREKEVLEEVIKGLSNKEVAGALYISEHTVKNHMTKIIRKLKVSDRSGAIAKVYQLGFIPID